MCIKITKCQNANQMYAYFFSQVHGQLFLLYFWWKKYKHENTWAFSFHHLQCFLCSILSRDLCSDNEKIPVTANEKKVNLGQVHTPITTDLWLLNYWTCASQYKGESLSPGKATVLVSLTYWIASKLFSPRLILYDNRAQEHRHSSS